MSFLDRFSKNKPGEKKPVAKQAQDDAALDLQKSAADVTSRRTAKQAGNSYRILVRPLFTEKSDLLKSQGKYTFIVSKNANKHTVKEAVRDLYGVTPLFVQIAVVKGKLVHFGRTQGKERNEKKAIVTLAAGQTLTPVEA